MIPNILSIAGSDPSGGAGIQADIKAIAANGGYAMAALTALTVQNTQGVTGVHLVPPEFVAAQINAVFADIRVDAVKLGMLATAPIILAIADTLEQQRNAGWRGALVLDPVMIATSGDALLAPDAVAVLRERLIPMADIITPNLPEAAALVAEGGEKGEVPRNRAQMSALADDLQAHGARAVYLKGGHLTSSEAPDLLAVGAEQVWLAAPRLPLPEGRSEIHGGGCTLASALATHLGAGRPMLKAASEAKAYVARAIEAADRLEVGAGALPLNHLAPLEN
ncbi:MAG: bifunctional hydroxymethylpyrimidine kinase/phosphomethylpyrimidine kinase [Neomegalonema sp.]|nr:bifunctional hydroxymethylpyrimidine kinase/phosphomethylpyrimidine kinase [Neomegalonema sp.]